MGKEMGKGFRLGPGRRRRKGTSLVEVMIAMVILALVLLAFLSIMHSANTTSANSKESSIAIYILQGFMEDSFAATYVPFWDSYFGDNSVDDQSRPLFADVMADSAITGELPTLLGLLPRIQGLSGPPLSQSESARWNGIVNDFKKHYRPLQPSGRLKNEIVRLYLLPTSDLYLGPAWKASTDALSHNYVEYMTEITWTDASGRSRHESITTRRSQ
jgi:prepilin-type N-terminal cleavage/methylation domain-containing protein